MRERRKKKRMYEKQQQAKDVATDAESATRYDATRKRPHHEALETPSSSTLVDAKKSSNTIIVPEGLSSKEVKKFRKDARRQARADGRDETKLVFVSAKANPEERNAKRRRKQSQQHLFPKLNELVAQERLEQERQQKETARIEAEASLSGDVKARYVALDCEMVGVGSSGKQSALARASLVDWNGNVLLDSFVQVPSKVTDFRTQYSGVLPRHLQSHNAMSVDDCRAKVTELLHGKILVGHALRNDLQALMLTHPAEDIRDTAKYRPYQRCGGDGKYRPRKLRDLVAEHCGMTIQRPGESHDSIDDARAALALFKVSRVAWEAALERKKRKGKA